MNSTTSEPGLTLTEAIEALKLVLEIEATTEKHILLEKALPYGKESAISKFEISEITSAIHSINSSKGEEDACIRLDRSCEFLLIRNNTGPGRPLPRDPGENEPLGESNITYSTGMPSLAFFLNYLVCLLRHNQGERKSLPSNIITMRRRLRERRYYSLFEEDENKITTPTLEEILGDSAFMITLKINSNKPGVEFKGIAESYLFGLAYNYDASFRISGSFEHLLEARVRRRGRATEASMDTPRMTYHTDLVHHYQLAVSADSPMLQYLSYYHIAEHFFEEVFNEDFVEQVRRKIADPAFSLRRTKDIQGIIKLINANQRKVRDEGGVDEQRALSLVLDRFIELPRLIDDLNTHDKTLIAHYKRHSPSFSEKIPVDLTATKESEIKNSLARRIYQIRNSLVHAKDGARPKYFPFVNDAELRKEVPLIRFCSEQIIIARGKII